jgi:hypothetical protein
MRVFVFVAVKLRRLRGDQFANISVRLAIPWKAEPSLLPAHYLGRMRAAEGTRAITSNGNESSGGWTA